jgi:hypothetical protein
MSKNRTNEFDINAAFKQLMNSIGLSPMDTAPRLLLTSPKIT